MGHFGSHWQPIQLFRYDYVDVFCLPHNLLKPKQYSLNKLSAHTLEDTKHKIKHLLRLFKFLYL